jgi:hypothetical protein
MGEILPEIGVAGEKVDGNLMCGCAGLKMTKIDVRMCRFLMCG